MIKGGETILRHKDMGKHFLEASGKSTKKWVINLSLTLVIAGYILLIGYGLIQYLSNHEEVLFGKIALTAIVLGGTMVFGIVFFERISTYKKDPYRKIEK